MKNSFRHPPEHAFGRRWSVIDNRHCQIEKLSVSWPEVLPLVDVFRFRQASFRIEPAKTRVVCPAEIKSRQRMRSTLNDASDLSRRELWLDREHQTGDSGDKWAGHACSTHRDPQVIMV